LFAKEILGSIFLKEVNSVITKDKCETKKKSRDWIQGKSKGFFSPASHPDRLFSPLSLIPKGNPGLFLLVLKQLESATDHPPPFIAKFKKNGAVLSNFHLPSYFVLNKSRA
jgi:hypothetical protein